jgi:hypothetical protein
MKRNADKENELREKVGFAMEPKSTLMITSKELKEIKDWKIGEKYRIVLTVEMESIHKDDDNICAHFVVNKSEV